MNKQVRIDLADAADAIEALLQHLPKMTMQDKIDTCARLRGAAKCIEQIDKHVKDEIKRELKQTDGSLLGRLYKAVLKYNAVNRFNQAKFKEERPKLFAYYVEGNNEPRITFEPR